MSIASRLQIDATTIEASNNYEVVGVNIDKEARRSGVSWSPETATIHVNTRIEGDGQVVFRYAEGTNPNGSMNDIAGIVSEKGNVLGMMPHPERMIEPAHGGSDGRRLFEGLIESLA